MLFCLEAHIKVSYSIIIHQALPKSSTLSTKSQEKKAISNKKKGENDINIVPAFLVEERKIECHIIKECYFDNVSPVSGKMDGFDQTPSCPKT